MSKLTAISLIFVALVLSQLFQVYMRRWGNRFIRRFFESPQGMVYCMTCEFWRWGEADEPSNYLTEPVSLDRERVYDDEHRRFKTDYGSCMRGIRRRTTYKHQSCCKGKEK